MKTIHYNKALHFLKKALTAEKKEIPSTVIVLGSGLGNLANFIVDPLVLPYKKIPYFPVSSVTGHEGSLFFGKFPNQKESVVLMKGRVHYYEGFSMEQVCFPIRLLRKLGARNLILTNSAGSLNPHFPPASLMLIKDHIGSFCPNPLIGKNDDSLGTRFPSMENLYHQPYREKMLSIAKKKEIPLEEGIYLYTTGPSYESPSETRYYASLGADAVGMSTVPEAISALHAGYKTLAISCITNLASFLSDTPLNHKEVLESASKVQKSFQNLIIEFVQEIENSI